MYTQVRDLLSQVTIDFGGGCSTLKAFIIADLIRRYDLRQTLDIGVYRGRSLLPQALAHLQYTGGVAYGVDPWDSGEALQHDSTSKTEHLKTWAETTDFDAIYRELAARRDRLGLSDHCQLLRMTSSAAAEQFGRDNVQFDLIHIDGNHDTAHVVQDVLMYSERLRSGGFIVLDDVSWESVAPADKLLSSRMTKLMQRVSGGDDFAIYRDPHSRFETACDAVLLRKAILVAWMALKSANR